MGKTQEYILKLRDQFSNQLKQADKAVKSFDKNASFITKTLRQLTPALGAVGIVGVAKNIAQAGIEMEQTEVAFKTLLGSAEKAKSLLSDLKKFAATTPFQLPEVLDASRQLLAYGFAQGDIVKNTRMLGDVSAGLKIPLGDMIYLYGTLRAQGRAYTRDIMQFTARGIPVIDELAKHFGVSTSKVKELVEDGKVGFKEIETIFQKLTSEGGKFNNLMADQSKTVGGQLSNLKDTIGLIATAIGQSYLPQLSEAVQSGLKWADWAEKHTDDIKKIIRVVLQAGKAFVIFKTSVLIAQKSVLLYRGAMQLAYFMTTVMTKGLKGAIVQAKIFNATMKANLIGLVITGVTFLIEKLIALRRRTKEQTQAQDQLNMALEETQRIMNQQRINDFLRSTGVLINQGGIDFWETSKESLQKLNNAIRTANLETIQGVKDAIDNEMIELQRRIDYINEQAKTVNLPEFVRKANISQPLQQLKFLEQITKSINTELKKYDKLGVSTQLEPSDQLSEITSKAPKIFNINIGKLIETQEINTTTLTEGKAKIKQLMSEAMLEILNEVQIMAAR